VEAGALFCSLPVQKYLKLKSFNAMCFQPSKTGSERRQVSVASCTERKPEVKGQRQTSEADQKREDGRVTKEEGEERRAEGWHVKKWNEVWLRRNYC